MGRTHKQFMMHSYVASQRQFTFMSTLYLQNVLRSQTIKWDTHIPLLQQSAEVLHSPATPTQLSTGVKALQRTVTNMPVDKKVLAFRPTTAVLVDVAFLTRVFATLHWCKSTKEDYEKSKVQLHHDVHSVERSKIVRHRLLWTFSL